MENRMLTTKPKLQWSSIVNGDYTKKFENYMTDQFVGRDFWRKMKVAVDQIGGGRQENGVLKGKKGQLMEQIEVVRVIFR